VLAQDSFPSEPQSALTRSPVGHSVHAPTKSEMSNVDRLSRLRPVLVDDASFLKRHPEFRFIDAQVQTDPSQNGFISGDWAHTPIYTHVEDARVIAKELPDREAYYLAADLMDRPLVDGDEMNQLDLITQVLAHCKEAALTENEVHYSLSTVAAFQTHSQLTDLYLAAKRTFFVLMCRLG